MNKLKIPQSYVVYSILAMLCILLGGYSFFIKSFSQNGLSSKEGELAFQEPNLPAIVQAKTAETIEHANSVQLPTLLATHNLQLSKARDGDSNAQYELAITLRKCSWDSKPTELKIEQTIEAMVNSGSEFDEAFFDELRNTAKECAPVYDLYGGKLLYNVREAWITESAAQGNQFALLSLAFREVDRFSDIKYQAHMKQLVEDAMKAALNEKSMLEHALYHAVNYRVNLHSIDKSVDPANKQTSDWALRLVECRFVGSGRQGCIKDFESEHELSEHYFLDPELTLAKAKAERLTKSILEQGGLVDFDIDTF